MKLSDISIRRPVLATMMNLALILFGLIGLSRLPVRELPDIDPPIVSVITVYPGASASVIETEVTEKLEETLNTIQGIKTMSSESREEVSNITIQFKLSRDIETSTQDVRDKIARVRDLLPDDIKEPVVQKQEADAQPILWLALFSDRLSPLELTVLAENELKDRFQILEGVGSVIIGGEKRFAVRLWLDSQKMAAHQVTVLDVEQALLRENVKLPSGRIENLMREFTISTEGELRTTEEFNNLIIRYTNNSAVRLRDIGRAEIGPESERTIARFNGKTALGLGIVKQSKANTISVADLVEAEVAKIRPTLPAGVELKFAYDSSIYVRRAIKEVAESILIAVALVVVIIFLFLRSLPSTLIPSVAIPISVIATFALMYFLGLTVNILTLLAMVLVIGIVVDDAIVVMENIYRHMEEGASAYDASRNAMKEIGMAVVSTTLALVVIFVPLLFLEGQTGRLFREFAIAVAGSVLISAFVALTFTPVLCSRYLKVEHEHGRAFQFFERFFNSMTAGYARWLDRALRHRVRVLALGAATVIASLFLFTRLPFDFLPTEDKGGFIGFLFAPEGATLEYSDRDLRSAEKIIGAQSGVEDYFSALALPFSGPGKVTDGIFFAKLKPWEQREVSQQKMVNDLGGAMSRVKGSLIFLVNPSSVGEFGQPVQIVLKSRNLRQLDQAAQQVAAGLRDMKQLLPFTVRSTFEFNKPELRVRIDRDKAAALGVTVRDISSALQILLGGRDLSKFKLENKEYDVIAQLQREDRLTPQALSEIYVRSASGNLVELTNVLQFDEGANPNKIEHYNRSRSTIVEATPAGELPMGDIAAHIEKNVLSKLPAGVTYDWESKTKNLRETSTDILFVSLVALLVVYMVLAAQYESFTHPLTIMLALPLAGIGAFGLLYLLFLLSQNPLSMAYQFAPLDQLPGWIKTIGKLTYIPSMNINLYSEIGLVLLIGLVTKNSILLVEFANQKMRDGHDSLQAMKLAGAVRFRPILMTALSTIIGLLPIAFAFGAGGEARRPLGVVVVGGMLSSTFLTLFVVPVVYTYMDQLQRFFHRKPDRSTTTRSG